jgi:hypothetical protein
MFQYRTYFTLPRPFGGSPFGGGPGPKASPGSAEFIGLYQAFEKGALRLKSHHPLCIDHAYSRKLHSSLKYNANDDWDGVGGSR